MNGFSKTMEFYDVIVAGAGPAGIGAALSAARAGAKTALVETHGCLGGVWTAGQLAWIFEGDNPGIASEIADKLKARGANNGPASDTYSYDIEAMKSLLESLCLEAGVRIRLFTSVVAAKMDGRRLTGIVTESKSGRELWPAKTFVDCTGDGDLGARAGNSFDLGGPSGETQPGTFMALVVVKDMALMKDFVSFLEPGDIWPRHIACSAKLLATFRKAGIEPSYLSPTMFHVHGNLCAFMVNHEYRLSAIDADSVTDATIRARAEVGRLVEGLRSLGGPWEGLTLAATAEQIGVREGRRLHGLYAVSDADLVAGAKFEDGVCLCRYGVDVHATKAGGEKAISDMNVKSKPYQIPYRALVAKDVQGLLMAGRCISGSWLAHASYRVTGTAVSLGEAAGRAAAFCAKNGRLPHEVSWKEIAS